MDTIDDNLICSILNHLDFPEVNALYLVNKQFYTISKDIYINKIEVSNLKFNKIYYKYLTEFHTEMHENIRCKIFVNFMKKISDGNHWNIRVHEIDFMETLFFIGTDLHIWRDSCDNYDKILNKIRPYLYIENPKRLNVVEMKNLVAFKGVRGVSMKSRTQLMHILRRPKNEVYFW